MPTHRYPLSDGRQLEIVDPIATGRAYIYVDGEFLGENTIHELRHTQRFTLPDGSVLLVHVVSSIPFFRLFDVRHNGAGVRRSASDPAWSRRTAIDILLLAAVSDVVLKLPSAPLEYVKAFFVISGLLLAIGIWRQFEDAPSLARKYLFIRCLFAALPLSGPDADPVSLHFDLVAFGLYFWMRHLTNVIEYTPELSEPTVQKMPQTTLT
jgi:hypothetical protein